MAYRDIILADAPRVYLEFENNTTNAGAVGTPTGAPSSYTTGKMGQAGVFTGAQNISFSGITTGGLGNTNSVSIEAWVRTTASGTVWIAEAGGGSGFRLRLNAGKAVVEMASGYHTGTINVNDGQWHHIVATRAVNYFYLYVDGVADGSSYYYTSQSNLLGQFYIGSNSGGNYKFVGDLDEVAVYGSTLSQQDVTDRFNGAAPPAVNITIDTETALSSVAGYTETVETVASIGVDVETPTISTQAAEADAFSPVSETLDVDTARVPSVRANEVTTGLSTTLITSRDYSYVHAATGPNATTGGINSTGSTVGVGTTATGGVDGPTNQSTGVFDFELPAGFTNGGLKTALLNLYLTYTDGGTYRVYRVTSEWASPTATPALSTEYVEFTPTGVGAVSLDVSSLIDKNTFYGFAVRRSSASGTTNIAALENATAANRPRLALSYDVLPEQPTILLATAAMTLQAPEPEVIAYADTEVNLDTVTVSATAHEAEAFHRKTTDVYASRDYYIRVSDGQINDTTRVYVGKYTTSPDYWAVGILDFELPADLTTTGLTSAYLKINIEQYTGAGFQIRPITSQFDEDDTTFILGDPMTITVLNTGQAVIDVTALIDSDEFYGLHFSQSIYSANYMFSFSSSSNATQSLRPRLSVQYTIDEGLAIVEQETATISLVAQDVVADVTTNPNVSIDVETPTASVQSYEAEAFEMSVTTLSPTFDRHYVPSIREFVDDPSFLLIDWDATTYQSPGIMPIGSTARNKIVYGALRRCDYPLHELKGPVSIKTAGVRDYVTVTWEDLSYLGGPAFQTTSTGETLHLNFGDNPETEARMVLGVASSNGTIKLDPILEFFPELAGEVLMHEIGHIVDFFLLEDADRVAIWNALHPDYLDDLAPGTQIDNDVHLDHNHGWLGIGDYYDFVGEAWGQLFVEAYSNYDIMDDDYSHKATEAGAREVRAFITPELPTERGPFPSNLPLILMNFAAVPGDIYTGDVSQATLNINVESTTPASQYIIEPMYLRGYDLVSTGYGYPVELIPGLNTIDLTEFFDSAKFDAIQISPSVSDGQDQTLMVSTSEDEEGLRPSLTIRYAPVSGSVLSDADSAAFSVTASEATAEARMNAVSELDTPRFSVAIRTLPIVNDEQILPSETDDPYFETTISSNPSIWMRLNEKSGTKVLSRTSGGQVATYNNVSIGQNNGPEGRSSVYFNGTGRIEQIEPPNTFDEFVLPEPFNLEFSFRTDKNNQFIMGGADTMSSREGVVGDSTGSNEFWLRDGKINFRVYQPFTYGRYGTRIYTGTPNLRENITGFKNLADGEWHHVVVNVGRNTQLSIDTDAFEIYIDGQLEVRKFFSGGQSRIGFPDFIGGRPSDNIDGVPAPTISEADWFVGDMSEIVSRKNTTLNEDQVTAQRDGFFYVRPVRVAPASITTKTTDVTIESNKIRVLTLDFGRPGRVFAHGPDPESYFQGTTKSGYRARQLSGWGEALKPWETFTGPQEWRGLSGYKNVAAGVESFPSLRVRLGVDEGSVNLINSADFDDMQFFHAFTRDGYRDKVTDNERLVNLEEDLNMDDYDIITIVNYPQTDWAWDWYDVMDRFNIPPYRTGRQQVEDILGQLKDLVVDGKRLFVNDPASAVALGLVDRVEYVPAMSERTIDNQNIFAAVGQYDFYSALNDEWQGQGTLEDARARAGRYVDLHKNNKQRVVEIIDGLTDTPSYIATDAFRWVNVDYTGANGNPNQIAGIHYEDRMNGLQPGDEFYMQGSAGPSLNDAYLFWGTSKDTWDAPRFEGWPAAPLSAVKSGTVVTTFGSYVVNGERIETNTMQDYAVSIVVKPGDELDGRAVSGKIYCNFTEAYTHWAPHETYEQMMEFPEGEYATVGSIRIQLNAGVRYWQYNEYMGTWSGSEIPLPDLQSVWVTGSNGQRFKKTQVTHGSPSGIWRWLFRPFFPTKNIPVFSMATRGWKWLTQDAVTHGGVSVALGTAKTEASANDVSVVSKASTEVNLSTARVTNEAIEMADVVAPDATVLVSTPTVSIDVAPWDTEVELQTAGVTIRAKELSDHIWSDIEFLVLTLPTPEITLYLEEAND